METGRKVRSILSALGILVFTLFLFVLQWQGDEGVFMLMFLLSVWLIVYGIRFLHFYSKMARHMVGGKIILVMGFVLIDFGVFNLSLTNRHTLFIILYLLGFYAFKGFVDVMRALEQKKNEDSGWKLKMSAGVVNVLVAITAAATGFFLKSEAAIVCIFAIGLLYSAVMKVVRAFRKTPVMTIL